jgi:hypothetical protein
LSPKAMQPKSISLLSHRWLDDDCIASKTSSRFPEFEEESPISDIGKDGALLLDNTEVIAVTSEHRAQRRRRHGWNTLLYLAQACITVPIILYRPGRHKCPSDRIFAQNLEHHRDVLQGVVESVSSPHNYNNNRHPDHLPSHFPFI